MGFGIGKEPSDLISPEHTRAVGSLVLAISVLDSRITDLLAAILKIDILFAVAALHHQQTSSRIDTAIALLDWGLRKQNPAEDKQFQPIFDLLNAAKRLADYRNTIVHATWTLSDDGVPTSVRFSARGEITRSRTPRESQEILSRALEAHQIAEKLKYLAEHFRG